MLKSTKGLIFILVANILLVGHSILPHDHQDGLIWLHSDHYTDSDEPSGINSEATNHQHDGQDDDQICLLKQVYLIPTDSSRLDCSLVDNLSRNLDFQPIYTNPDPTSYLPFFYTVSGPPPLLLWRYSLLATHSIGLRGPPTF